MKIIITSDLDTISGNKMDHIYTITRFDDFIPSEYSRDKKILNNREHIYLWIRINAFLPGTTTLSDENRIGRLLLAVYSTKDFFRYDQWTFGNNQKRSIWIQKIDIDDKFQKRGIGSHMIDIVYQKLIPEIVPLLDKDAKRNIYLASTQSSSTFYPKVGFIPIWTDDDPRDEDFPYGEHCGWFARPIEGEKIDDEKPLYPMDGKISNYDDFVNAYDLRDFNALSRAFNFKFENGCSNYFVQEGNYFLKGHDYNMIGSLGREIKTENDFREALLLKDFDSVVDSLCLEPPQCNQEIARYFV